MFDLSDCRSWWSSHKQIVIVLAETNMLQLGELLQILNFFRIILVTLRRRRQRREADEQDDNFDLQIFGNFIKILFNWIQLVCYFLRFIRIRQKRKKLINPHKMLPMMGGYRMQRVRVDMWNILQRNWTNFFWLTGETPITLRFLINRILTTFPLFNNLGRNCSLDWLNQVCSIQ